LDPQELHPGRKSHVIKGRILLTNRDLQRKRYAEERLYPLLKVPTPRLFVMRLRAGLVGSQIPQRKGAPENLPVRFLLLGFLGRWNIKQKRKGSRSVTNQKGHQILRSMAEGKW